MSAMGGKRTFRILTKSATASEPFTLLACQHPSSSKCACEAHFHSVLAEVVELDVAVPPGERVADSRSEAGQHDTAVEDRQPDLGDAVRAPDAEQRIGGVVADQAETRLDLDRIAARKVARIAEAEPRRPVGKLRSARRLPAG